MKKRTIALLAACALAIVLAAGAGIGRAYAYFTTYVEAAGVRTIHLGDWSEIDEQYKHWHKDITITNKADSYDAVYVRIKVFVGDDYSIKETSIGAGWEATDWDSGVDDGTRTKSYVYDKVLVPGESTTQIGIDILDKDGNEFPVLEGEDEDKTVNVIVIYETTPAIQNGTDASGNIIYEPADWNRKATKTQTSQAEEVTTTAAEGGND